PDLTYIAGCSARQQVLARGDRRLRGVNSCPTGRSSGVNAGASFNVTVNAVDGNWNGVRTNGTVAITSTDANATVPVNTALVAGTKTLSVTFRTAGSATVTASDSTNPSIPSSASPSITVNVGAVAKLQILLPGETAVPGSASGKSGTPTAQTAGTAIAIGIVVRAVDA